jgi:hypothetical protein
MPLLPLPLPPLPPPPSPPAPPPPPPASEARAAAKADAAIGRHSRVWDALVLSSLGLPPLLCRAAGGACRRQLPFPASSAARKASGTSELVSQRSRCNSACHSWQHTHGPQKFSTPVFSADNTSAFVKKSRNLVCNSVLCPKKLARIGCCLRWTCLLLLAGMDSESLWVHHLAPDDRFKSIQSTTPVEMRADLNFLKWFGSTLLLVLAIAYEPERN